jgi:dUTP pyrophosphatase
MSTIYTVKIWRLPHTASLAADLPLPAYQSAGAAGLDLSAAIDAPIVIAPGRRAAIPTGLAFALPPGIEGQIRPRSGLALHHGVTVLNSPGTIDPDYRGELHVVLANFGGEPFVVERGARIAQLVFARAERVQLHEVELLDETTRGVRGVWFYGHGAARAIVRTPPLRARFRTPSNRRSVHFSDVCLC